MGRLAILQSNYIPWKGYFDIINSVDHFIFHDDLQYTAQDWRNRNKIKTMGGLKWLSIPCGSNEKRLISEVALNDSSWQKKHWNFIQESYRKAPHFRLYKDFFEEIYLSHKWSNLSNFNQHVIKRISCELLNIDTSFSDSREYNLTQKKGDRVIELLEKASATAYLSGPSAKDYLSETQFEEKAIELCWMDYDNYPEYSQLYPPFEHQVTILDLLFNVGEEYHLFMKSY